MEQSELRSVLEVLKTAALKASEYVLSAFGQESSVKYKADSSPFTIVNVNAENMTCAVLAAAYPSITIVGEEMQAGKNLLSDLQNADFFLIDALDRTKEFITGNKDFTINVAFVRNGTSILGVVIAPAHKVAYWGDVRLGAFKAEVINGCIL